MSIFSPLSIVNIVKKYQYKVELYRTGPNHACLRISDPYIKSPFPNNLDSDVRTYSYCKRLFEGLDIRYKI